MKNISSNFGNIKDAIFFHSAKELMAENKKSGSDKKKSEILNKFFNMIKENHILRLQYLIYKNIENGSCTKERLAERFINQNLKLIEKCNWHDIIQNNKDAKFKLLGSEVDIDSSADKTELYEAIHTLIKSTTLLEFSEIDKSQQAFDLIMEHLLKEKSIVEEQIEDKEHPKFFSWQFITEHAVSKFNERYNHLTISEKDLIKVLLSSDENKKNYFDDLKESNLNAIEKLLSEDNIDDTIKTAVNKFKSKMLTLNELSFHPQIIDETIINLAELKESLEEIEKNKISE